MRTFRCCRKFWSSGMKLPTGWVMPATPITPRKFAWKNAATAIDFLQNLKKGLQPKFNAELEEFRQMKIKETGDPTAKIYVWDWRYYANELKKTKYNVDAEQLRVYFPYERVLEGL